MTSLGISGMSQVAFYPDVFPDLCVGAPITICGRYQGNASSVQLSVIGSKSDDNIRPFYLTPINLNDSSINMSVVVDYFKIEMLSELWWLSDDIQTRMRYREDVAKASINSKIPSMFTTMISQGTSG